MTMDMENIKKESKYLGQLAKTTTEEIIMALRDKQRTFLENLQKTESEQSVLVQKTLDEYLEVKIKIGTRYSNTEEFRKTTSLWFIFRIKANG